MKIKLMILAVTLISASALAMETAQEATASVEETTKEVDRTAEATRIAKGECSQVLRDYLTDCLISTLASKPEFNLLDKYFSTGTPTPYKFSNAEKLEQDIEENGSKIRRNGFFVDLFLKRYEKCVKETTAKVLETKFFKK